MQREENHQLPADHLTVGFVYGLSHLEMGAERGNRIPKHEDMNLVTLPYVFSSPAQTGCNGQVQTTDVYLTPYESVAIGLYATLQKLFPSRMCNDIAFALYRYEMEPFLLLYDCQRSCLYCNYNRVPNTIDLLTKWWVWRESNALAVRRQIYSLLTSPYVFKPMNCCVWIL